jgi:hypothetical protein
MVGMDQFEAMFESYLAKVVLSLIGAGAMFAAIAGGYYMTFMLVTAVGA